VAEGKAAYSYQYPAEYISQMLRGGEGVFGLFPGMNRYMQSQFASTGAPGSSPYTYTGPRIAGFSPREEAGMRMSDAGIGSWRPYLARSQGLSEEAVSNMMRGTTEGSQMLRESAGAQYDPSTAYQEYMDPYTSEVIDRATADIREDTEKAKAGARDRAISQGAFGGSRGRLGAEEIERGAARSIGDMASQLRSQGYGTAQQQAMGEFARQQAAKAAGGQGIAGMAGALGQGLGAFGDRYSNLAGTMTGMMGQDIGRQMQMGGMNRARNQALMDLAYQNYVGQYNMPMTLMGQYGNMLSSLGPLAGGIGYSGKWPSSGTQNERGYGGTYYNPGTMPGYQPPQAGDGGTDPGDGGTDPGDGGTDPGDGGTDPGVDPGEGRPPDDDVITPPGYPGIPMNYGPGGGFGYPGGGPNYNYYGGYSPGANLGYGGMGAGGYGYGGGYGGGYGYASQPQGGGTQGTGTGTTGQPDPTQVTRQAYNRGGLINLIRSRRRG